MAAVDRIEVGEQILRGTRDGRRRELIEATIGVVGFHGLAGATLARVASEAGLSAGIVNHHFDTKESLLTETLRHLADEFSDALTVAMTETRGDPVAGLHAIIDLTFDPLLSQPDRVAVWFAFHSESRWRDSYTTLCGERDKVYFDAIEGLFEALIEDKNKAHVLARAFAGLLDTYWQDLLFIGDTLDREKAKLDCQTFLAAVLPATATATLPSAAPARTARSVLPFPVTGDGYELLPDDPEGPPHTLPAWIYTSDEFFELEKQEIFMKEWHIVCHVNEIPNVGDYSTFELLGQRVFVVRGASGGIGGFHNVCRHRAHALVTGQSGTCPKKGITCPYHGWVYGLDGKLEVVSAPHSFNEFEHLDFGLPPVETEVHMGFVYVRFGGDGPSVAERFAPYAEEMAKYRFEELIPMEEEHTFNETGADWKNVWDNYLEGYHFAMGHPGLYGLTGQRYDIEAAPDERVARLGHSLRDKPATSWSGRMYQKILQPQAHLPEEMQTNWSYFFMYPLLSFDVYPEVMGTFQVIPISPGRSQLRYRNYRLPEQNSRRDNAARWLNWRINAQVQSEDDTLVDSVQHGLTSDSYIAGILSEKEVIVHNFQNWVRRSIPAARLAHAPEKGSLGRINKELARK